LGQADLTLLRRNRLDRGPVCVWQNSGSSSPLISPLSCLSSF